MSAVASALPPASRRIVGSSGMRVAIVSLVVLVAAARSAIAQPGQTPPVSVDPSYYQPAPPVLLSSDEQALLARGEISDSQQIGGTVLSLVFGLGVGQAAEGRWSDTGWIFTVGEIGAATAIVVGVSEAFACDGAPRGACGSRNDRGAALAYGGLLVFGGLHVWEIVDAIVGPRRHNDRVRALRARLGQPQPTYGRLAPYVTPTYGGNGGVAGVALTF
jgi:hypothetical protein